MKNLVVTEEIWKEGNMYTACQACCCHSSLSRGVGYYHQKQYADGWHE